MNAGTLNASKLNAGELVLRLQTLVGWTRGSWWLSLLGLLCMFGLSSATVHAWDGEVDTERALRSLQRTTWYDSEQQTYAPPRVRPEKDTSIRVDGWEAKPKAEGQPWTWDWFKNWNFGGFFSGLGEFFSRLILVLLVIVLLGVIGGLLYYAFRDYFPQRNPREKSKRAIVIDPTRIEDLPFEVRANSGDPLAEARRLYEAGRYDQAIIYLYGYMLLVLDNAHKIHLVKGKTNRMYLRELRREPTRLRAIMEMTMLAFEQVYFGKHSISAEHFALLWGQLEEFHQLVTEASGDKAAESGLEVAPA